MKKSLLLLTIFITSGCLTFATPWRTVLQDYFDKDTVLEKGIYEIENNVKVSKSATLTIKAGTKIYFKKGASLIVALKEFSGSITLRGLLKRIRRSKDAAGFAVIIEDLGAMVGLIIAFIGVFVGDFFDVVYADGIASIIIGLILTSMAVILATETKGLLLGESLRDDEVRKIERLLNKHQGINKHGLIKSIHFGPQSVLVAIDVEFSDKYSIDALEIEIERIEKEIKNLLPHVDKVYLEAKNLN